MQITGAIQSLNARVNPDGTPDSFTTQYGVMYAFDMTVNGTTGQINSKSPQYPAKVGDSIIVETTDGQYGIKFKKVNPQYANQGGGQSQAPPQNAPRPSQNPATTDVQDDIRFAQSVNLAVSEYTHGKIDEPAIEGRTKMYYAILKTRIFPAIMSANSPVFEQQPSADDMPWGS